MIQSPYQSLSRKKSLVLYFFLGLIVISTVSIDQLTKIHAHNTYLVWSHPTDVTMYQGRYVPVTIIGSREEGHQHFALGWSYARNRGAAWSLFDDLADHIRVPFFYCVFAIAFIVIISLIIKTPNSEWLKKVAFFFILGGAIGNFVDRLRLGYVIDFIDVDWNILGWSYHFPIFNVADISVNIGVFLLILEFLIFETRRKKLEQGQNQAAA